MTKKQNFYFKSTNNKDRIHGVCWIPEKKKVRAVLQISHGMVEYIGRYEGLARYLCAKGFAVVGHDHLGHGQSVKSEKDWGYLGENGFEYMVKDIHKVQKHFQRRFRGVPYFILGHSMGSFLLRYFLTKYGKEIDGAIIMGTGYYSGALTKLGCMLTKVIAKFKGWHYRSALVNKMAFGSYNKEFEPARTPFDWLSRDEKMVDKYISEPQCQFVFTLNGYYELFHGLNFISKKGNMEKMPKKLPILFMSGDADPVGADGDGVQKVYEDFEHVGMKHMELYFYEDGRHELTNEINRKEVYADIYQWIKEEIWLRH